MVNQLRERNLGLLAALGAFVFFFVATVALCHCSTPAILRADPKVYPCGVGGQRCNGGACCWADYACGPDDPSCPAGACCLVPVGVSRDGGPVISATVIKPQWAP